MKVTPQGLLKGYQARPADIKAVQKRHKTDFLEGLRILVTEKYLLGMFSVIFLYEMLTTVFDYHLKQAVGEFFPIEVEAAAYLASYAQWVGIVSTASVFFGINNIQRYVGMTASLVLLPAFVACAVLAMYLYPAAINVVFWIMVLSKAVNYALNQPTMKQLYIPTTPEVKYKAQAWLEMFGSRGSKAVGSLLNSVRGVMGLPMFMAFFSSLSIGLIGVWIFVAIYIARMYSKAIQERRVVC
jgi:AAA family ATP:ADP antiporter